MAWTLWRHLLSELLKMLVVTTGVIVTVIAFGAAAKPLAENLIGAETVAKYVTLATIPMLQFALPFAAGFAATLVLHRLVTDNEVTAMSACGMSYSRILIPVGILGAILGVGMFVLVAFIVPRFWTRMKVLATADATQLLVGAVQRGEAFDTGKMLIYADSVEQVPAPADTGAQRRLVLRGVAAIEMGKERTGPPSVEFTAEGAAIDVHVTDSGTVAKIVLQNATVFKPSEGAIASVPRAEPDAMALDSGFYRGPKFLPLDELIALRNDVDRAIVVQKARRPLRAVVGEYEMWKCLLAQVDGTGTVELEQPGSHRSFRLEGAAFSHGDAKPALADGVVRVTELQDGKPLRRTETDRVSLRAVSEAGFEPRFSLVVTSPKNTRDLVENAPARWSPRMDDLVPVGCERRDWKAASSAELLAAASAIPTSDSRAPYKAISERAGRSSLQLREQRRDVRDESDSHLMQRVAQSVSVGLVLLLGAVLAVWLRRALPLTVYVLAFLPAVSNILLIAGGQQMMREGYILMGGSLMWSGNALLAAALLWTWARLARN